MAELPDPRLKSSTSVTCPPCWNCSCRIAWFSVTSTRPVREPRVTITASAGSWGLLEVRPLDPTLEELFVRLLGTERGASGDA